MLLRVKKHGTRSCAPSSVARPDPGLAQKAIRMCR
jgi:hypothetical protein